MMKKVILIFLIFLLTVENVEAGRGCCSWHGGVSGCGSNGRIVCNDGTYSKSCVCTPPKVYGCTNFNAINYNSNANIDDGSCRYQKEKMETITLNYDIEYRNPDNIDDGIEKIIQYGKNGIKIIKYKIITDNNDNEIERTVMSEVIISEPVKEIIEIQKKKELSTVKNSDTIVTNTDINTDSYTPNSDSILFILYLVLSSVNIILSKKDINKMLIFKTIRSQKYKFVRCLLYIIYFVTIIPVVIDFMYYIFSV